MFSEGFSERLFSDSTGVKSTSIAVDSELECWGEVFFDPRKSGSLDNFFGARRCLPLRVSRSTEGYSESGEVGSVLAIEDGRDLAASDLLGLGAGGLATLRGLFRPPSILDLSQSTGGCRRRSLSSVGDTGSVSSPLEWAFSSSDIACRGLCTAGGVQGGRPRDDSGPFPWRGEADDDKFCGWAGVRGKGRGGFF